MFKEEVFVMLKAQVVFQLIGDPIEYFEFPIFIFHSSNTNTSIAMDNRFRNLDELILKVERT